MYSLYHHIYIWQNQLNHIYFIFYKIICACFPLFLCCFKVQWKQLACQPITICSVAFGYFYRWDDYFLRGNKSTVPYLSLANPWWKKKGSLLPRYLFAGALRSTRPACITSNSQKHTNLTQYASHRGYFPGIQIKSRCERNSDIHTQWNVSGVIHDNG